VVHQQLAAGMLIGSTYEIRTEWGSFGIRVKVNGNVILAQSARLQLTPTVLELGWVHSPYNRGLILGKLDAKLWPNPCAAWSFVF
jgi:hypothetical protein